MTNAAALPSVPLLSRRDRERLRGARIALDRLTHHTDPSNQDKPAVERYQAVVRDIYSRAG